MNKTKKVNDILSTNGPGDRGSIPGRVIPKTQEMVLDIITLLNIRYVSRVMRSNQRKEITPSSAPQCSSY